MRRELAIISELVERKPHLGRTALVKCLYFLKALKSVPLDYHFKLHAYGPFDSNVLDDLSYAESLGAISMEMTTSPSGYDYKFKPGPSAEEIKQHECGFLAEYSDSIEWVIDKFADTSAADLEMLSTLIFIDKSACESGTTLSTQDLAIKVNDIKPSVERTRIEEKAEWFRREELLCGSA